MSTYDLILKRRSIRKFQNKEIDFEILKKCVNAARLAPSSVNLQPLEYIIVNEKKLLERIDSCLNWATYLGDFDNSNNKPVAHIIILTNKKINPNSGYDVGLSAFSIVLTAFEHEIGSCILRPINKTKIREILNIGEDYEIEVVDCIKEYWIFYSDGAGIMRLYGPFEK